MSNSLNDLGEDALVARLIRDLPSREDVIQGPGDDCAVIRPEQDPTGENLTPPTDLLFKTDAVVEGVHYLAKELPERVGAKALKRAISDIAAMGGHPEHALITVALRGDVTIEYVDALYKGLGQTAERFGISIVGGETVGLPAGAPNLISVSLTGTVIRGGAIFRSGGSVGDWIFVTGRLGGSLMSEWHLDFEPRLEEANWLRETLRPTAMMDLSDGLAKDLPRLAGQSGTGWQIDPARLPLHDGCSAQAGLGDGEDYELLFTIDPRQTDETWTTHWQNVFPKLELTHIGELTVPTTREGLDPSEGWDHF